MTGAAARKDGEADYERRQDAAIGVCRPPDRRCPSCGGGLQSEDEDDSLCRTCRWTFEHLGPGRPQ